MLCDICTDPIAGPPTERAAHGEAYRLCPACAAWGYLISAFKPHRTAQWVRARIFGARNAARWAAGELTDWERAGLDVHVPYHRRAEKADPADANPEGDH
jgi:hypothetical protein